MYEPGSSQSLVPLVPHGDEILLSYAVPQVLVLLLVILDGHDRRRLPILWGIVVPSPDLYMVWKVEELLP